ncbi:MAG: hypothetical protein M1828_003878 [Chrysothrix sp. TS-e1954]|nr:MAG: hypothetical protein M1828_003878 [Chrysothrix sp. TS-e1954]
MDLTELRTLIPSASTTFLFLVLSTAGLLLYNYLPRRFPFNAPSLVSGRLPVIGPLRFFTARWDFFRDSAAHSATGNFSFHVGKYQVVGLSGDEPRKLFFDSKGLDLSEGNAILFNGLPPMRENSDDPHAAKGFPAYINRRIMAISKPEILARYIPKYMADIRHRLDDIISSSPNNVTEPFDSIYNLVFQLTMRTVGCNEVADDLPLLYKVLGMYEKLEESSTPTTLLFPRFPWPAIISRYWNGLQMYLIFKRFVDDRKRTGRREADCLQFLIDEGDTTPNIVTFVQAALFAGVVNTGINAAYVITCLARYPEWRHKCREEIVAVAGRYASDPSAPLASQLEAIPQHEWETGFQVIQMCIRDSIRVQLHGAFLRLNVSGEDIEIPGTAAKSPTGKPEVIPKGAVVSYHHADVHQDPAIYPNPERWDPSRYMEGREEDKNGNYVYLGWGASKHPCKGMRIAKLEQVLIVAHFLASFEFWLVDEHGLRTDKLPHLDQNETTVRKPRERVYVKFERREK